MHRFLNVNYLYIIIFFCIGCLIFQKFFFVSIGSWSLGEWLINYEGGFVRRGLMGQLFQLFDRPGYIVNLFQKTIILLFILTILIYLYLEKRKILLFQFTIILLFSFGGFIDYLTSEVPFEYLDRKEIFFYLILMFLLILKYFFPLNSYFWITTCSVLSSLMILTHELFAVFFIPTLYFIIILNISSDKKFFSKSSLIFLVPNIIVFLLVFINNGDKEIAIAIFKSYEFTDVQDIYKVGSGIQALAWTFEQSNSLVLRMIKFGSIYPWVFYIFFNLFLCIFLAYFSKNNFKDFLISIIILLLFMPGLIIASYAGWDWGRFISISTIGYAILLCIHFSNYKIDENSNENKNFLIFKTQKVNIISLNNLIIFALISLLILISISITMPNCCPQKSINLFEWWN